MFRILALLTFFILFWSACFSQGKSNSVIVNKKVEVVEYDYQYVIVELISAVHYSSFYPLLTSENVSQSQLYFEKGRNIRLGSEIGVTQFVQAGCWSLFTGVSYKMYNEYFSYYNYEVREISLQNQDGTAYTTTVAVGDPVLYSHNNLLRYLKIPFGVNYFPKKWHNKLGISLAANYQYLITADYLVKYSSIKPASLLSINDFSRSYFSLSTGICIRPNLYKNYSVEIEPYFNLGLSQIINKPDLNFGVNEVGLKASLMLCY